MTAGLDIIDPGMAVAVQDRGRFGWRRFGVPVAGALDPTLLACANLLLGNAPDSAGLEILVGGPTVTAVDDSIGIALAGALSGEKTAIDGSKTFLPPWRAVRLDPGDMLRILPPQKGIGYVAISGGVRTAPLLGSRATYRRAGLGGFLAAGDHLPCQPVATLSQSLSWEESGGPIRLLAGPQAAHFSQETLASLTGADYRVAANSDRMGLRLSGPLLTHTALGAEIPTDPVTPGAIQVPGDGQPIILLADGQTTGGYAKIATVISADLPRLGHAKPGDVLRFRLVERDEAIKALKQREADFARWRARIGEAAGEIDQTALYECNLISGAITGKDE